MRLTYVVLHVQCACNTGLVYLPKAKLAASRPGQSVAVFSSRDTGADSRGPRCNIVCRTDRSSGQLTYVVQ